jgi:hypothetical protein
MGKKQQHKSQGERRKLQFEANRPAINFGQADLVDMEIDVVLNIYDRKDWRPNRNRQRSLFLLHDEEVHKRRNSTTAPSIVHRELKVQVIARPKVSTTESQGLNPLVATACRDAIMAGVAVTLHREVYAAAIQAGPVQRRAQGVVVS